MQRIVARFAVVLSLIVYAAALHAADRLEAVSTHCVTAAVALDRTHDAARLVACGDDYPENLLWHLDRIDQVAGRLDGHADRSNGGGGTVVYVMDTGVMRDHAEFATANGSRVIAGYDATRSLSGGNSRCTSDDKALDPCYARFDELAAASHGTSVASLVAGAHVGVAPDASIVSIRVMNESGLATTRTYLDGLEAIIRNAFDPATPSFHTAVVNISGWMLETLGGERSSRPSTVPFATVEKTMRNMIDGVDAAGNRDVAGKHFLFVVAGNNLDHGCGPAGVVDRFPATLGKQVEGIVTVGGMTASNSWWSGACRGGIEVLAPAQEIFSATITGRDQFRGAHPDLRSGTSFAAPIIAGLAARLLHDEPWLSPEELEHRLTATPSRIVNPAASYGDGKVAIFHGTASPAGNVMAELWGDHSYQQR